jgi:hypothetical protein
MKLKATINVRRIGAKVVVHYNGKHNGLMRDEQHAQFQAIVTSIAKCLLDSKTPYAGRLEFKDLQNQ